MRTHKHTMSTSLPVAWFSVLAFSLSHFKWESSAVALSRTRTQRAKGAGLGEREERAQTENDDKTCERERRWKKGRILQPSVKTQKIIIQCSSSSFPSGEFPFFLGKRLTVRVLLLRLILLCCKRVFLCTWVSGQQTPENKGNVRPLDVTCRTRVVLYVLLRSSWPGLLLSFRRASKGRARDYYHYNFFPEKSHQFFNLSAKET